MSCVPDFSGPNAYSWYRIYSDAILGANVSHWHIDRNNIPISHICSLIDQFKKDFKKKTFHNKIKSKPDN